MSAINVADNLFLHFTTMQLTLFPTGPWTPGPPVFPGIPYENINCEYGTNVEVQSAYNVLMCIYPMSRGSALSINTVHSNQSLRKREIVYIFM